MTPLENISKSTENSSSCGTHISNLFNNDVHITPAQQPQEPSELLSRALKRKFIELDEITQRLRLRLSKVTNDESDTSNDELADEFERDINTLCVEDDYDMINFEMEEEKVMKEKNDELRKMSTQDEALLQFSESYSRCCTFEQRNQLEKDKCVNLGQNYLEKGSGSDHKDRDLGEKSFRIKETECERNRHSSSEFKRSEDDQKRKNDDIEKNNDAQRRNNFELLNLKLDIGRINFDKGESNLLSLKQPSNENQLDTKKCDALKHLPNSSNSSAISEIEIPRENLRVQRDINVLDRQLISGKQRIDTLLEKLSLMTQNEGRGDGFNSRYVSGCSITTQDAIKSDEILKELGIDIQTNIDPDCILNPMLFEQLCANSLESTSALQSEKNNSSEIITTNSSGNTNTSDTNNSSNSSLLSQISRAAPDGSGNTIEEK